jgi:hypothetical protein
MTEDEKKAAKWAELKAAQLRKREAGQTGGYLEFGKAKEDFRRLKAEYERMTGQHIRMN